MFKSCYRCCLFYFGFGRHSEDVGLNLGLLENGNSVAGSTEHYTVQKISRFVLQRNFKMTKIAFHFIYWFVVHGGCIKVFNIHNMSILYLRTQLKVIYEVNYDHHITVLVDIFLTTRMDFLCQVLRVMGKTTTLRQKHIPWRKKASGENQ